MESMVIFDSTDETEINQSQPILLHAHRVKDESRNFLRRESQIPDYAPPLPLPAIRDGGGGSYESYVLVPPPPAGFDHQQCDYQNSTPDANELCRSPEPPTGLTTADYYMKSPATDSLPLQYYQHLSPENAQTFEPHPLIREAWDSLRRSLLFFRQDHRGCTASLLKDQDQDQDRDRDRDDVDSGCGETIAQDLYPAVTNDLLADFGLARLGPDSLGFLQKSHDSHLLDIIRYCAPEYTGSEVATNTTIFRNTDNILPNDANIYQDQIHIDMKDNLRKRIRMLEEGWRTTTMMSDLSLVLGALAIGAVVSNALTRDSSSSSASVGTAVVLGLGLTLGGIATRGRKLRGLSVLMTKLGTAATASGILLSLGSHLPPAAACVVGPLAFLVVVVAVVLA